MILSGLLVTLEISLPFQGFLEQVLVLACCPYAVGTRRCLPYGQEGVLPDHGRHTQPSGSSHRELLSSLPPPTLTLWLWR